jgi:hypothetical protein
VEYNGEAADGGEGPVVTPDTRPEMERALAISGRMARLLPLSTPLLLLPFPLSSLSSMPSPLSAVTPDGGSDDTAVPAPRCGPEFDLCLT